MESISFSIAGCEIRLLMPFRPEVTRGFQPFLCAPGEAPLTVSLLPVQALPEVRGRELLRNYAFAVFRTEDGFFRVFHDRREGDGPTPSATWSQTGARPSNIWRPTGASSPRRPTASPTSPSRLCCCSGTP